MSVDNKTRDALGGAPIPQQINPIEVVKTGSVLDLVLWVIALALLVGATLINQYLPAYWVPANNVWVRIGAIVATIVVAIGLLYATQQGKAFIGLLKDSRVELRRVTWPTKQETVATTWQVLLVVVVMSLILWGFDTLFGWFVQSIIG
jgi:preprotein translocase subunit SecE